MNKIEAIFIVIAIIVLVACMQTIPQYYFIFLFLLALAILFMVMIILAKYKKRFESSKLSILFYLMGIILFVIYFMNSVYMDLTNKGSTTDGIMILFLFVLVIFFGWLFEKNK